MKKSKSISNKKYIKRIDIFPHSGSEIPEAVVPLIRKDISKKEIEYTIEIDRDSGLEKVIESYQKNPAEGQILLTYDYTKVLGNVNRLEPERQVPEEPYKGEKFVEIDNNVRKMLVEKYVLPWQRRVIDTVSRHPEAIIVQWHSMDIYGGGNSTLKADTGGADVLRPLGELFTRGDAQGASMLPLFPEFKEHVLETYYLEEKTVDMVLDLLTKRIAPLASEGASEFVKDYPYTLFGQEKGKRIFGPALPNLIDLANGRKTDKQLVFEVRKDIFDSPSATEVLRDTIDYLVDRLVYTRY